MIGEINGDFGLNNVPGAVTFKFCTREVMSDLRDMRKLLDSKLDRKDEFSANRFDTL